MGMDTAVFKQITNRDLLHSTGNAAQCHVAARMGAWGRVDTCTWVAESLCCILKPSQHVSQLCPNTKHSKEKKFLFLIF